MRAAGWVAFISSWTGIAGPVSAAPAFSDVTSAANLQFFGSYGTTFAVNFEILQRNMGNGAAVGDIDGDGDLDVYLLASMTHPNVLYRNDLDQGLKSFTDVTTSAGVGDTGLSRVAHFVDLDNDGDLDLLLLNDNDGTDPSRLYRNDGSGTFTDVTAGSGFAPEGYVRAGCALADYDNDGLLDVYVTNWSLEGGSGNPGGYPGENRLYRNLGNLKFLDVTVAVGLNGLGRDSFTPIFVDFNGDNLPDIYVAIDHTSDEFYVNQGGSFTKVTTAVGITHVGNDMGVACADFDNDGDLDIYVTNITDPTGQYGTTQGNVFYINQFADTGVLSFVDEASARGVYDTYWGWGTDFFDVENDGDLDIVAVNGFSEFIIDADPLHPLILTPTVLFLNDGTGVYTREFAPGLEPTDDSRALIAFDYDRDGDRDLLITNVNQDVRLLENVSVPQGHWLDVRVVQSQGSNRSGIGVTVEATYGGVTRRRTILAGCSFLAGTPAEVHFGLGDSTIVNTLRVKWTDGSATEMFNIAADQMWVVDQSGEPIPAMGQLGMVVMAAAMLGLATWIIRRRASPEPR